MKLNRENLVKSLEQVYPAIGTNILVPEFGYFQIDGQRIQACDGAMFIDTACPEDTGLSCGVPAALFLNLLRSLDEEEIEIICKDDKIKVKTDKIKGTFTVLDKPVFKERISSYFSTDSMESKLFDFSDLVKGLSLCRFAVSKDETSGAICGVRIDGNSMFATDRYRIINWQLDNPLFDHACSLPPKFIDIVVKNEQKISGMTCVEGMGFEVLLKDGTYIGTPILTGEYPNLSAYFPDSKDFQQIDFGDEIDSILERHINFLKDVEVTAKEVTISICDNKCTISSKIKELDSLTEEFDLVCSEGSDCVTFAVNPILLKDIVKICTAMKFYTDKKLVLFETNKLRYLVQTRE